MEPWMTEAVPIDQKEAFIMSERIGKDRLPWLAGFLSLVQPGLGHLYGGNLKRAAVSYAAVELGFMLAVIMGLAIPAPRFGLLAGLLFLVVIRILVIVDSMRTARSAQKPYPLRHFNRVVVYLVVLLGLGLLQPALTVGSTVFGYYRVPTVGMQPTILSGDRVLVNKLTYHFREPKRGDLAVFRVPNFRDVIQVKRLIGLPGERIEISEERVLINGRPFENDPGFWGGKNADLPPNMTDISVTVPLSAVFLLGDNRYDSADSRYFGFVPVGDLVGVVQTIVWSKAEQGNVRWERVATPAR